MPTEIIPPNQPPTPPTEPPTAPKKLRIECECCGSTLDRTGGLIKRGEMAKQMIEAEDTIASLKKSITKAEEQNAALRQEIDSLKSQIPPETRKSIWSREA